MGDRWATIDAGRKVRGGCCVSFRGFESNTMWPGLRHTSISSGILIHPTVWSQCTNVKDRHAGQRSRTNGRTVTSNKGAQKQIIGHFESKKVPDIPQGSITIRLRFGWIFSRSRQRCGLSCGLCEFCNVCLLSLNA